MKSVIHIPENNTENNEPVEFTHLFTSYQMVEAYGKPNDYNKIVYLGKCKYDGDLFAAYEEEKILLYKGHLNSGKY